LNAVRWREAAVEGFEYDWKPEKMVDAKPRMGVSRAAVEGAGGWGGGTADPRGGACEEKPLEKPPGEKEGPPPYGL
jgi:hypothetical protein